MLWRMLNSLSTTSKRRPGKGQPSWRATPAAPPAAHGPAPGDADAEQRATPRLRAHLDGVVENPGDPLDNRQPQAHTLAFRGAPDVELVEFEEDILQLVLGNPATAVAHLHPEELATFAHAQQHPPCSV